MKTIAVFGGTFNPIHNGHLHLLSACKEKLSFDFALLIPDKSPVHKAGRDMASPQDRLEMCRLAVRGIPWCEVSDMEIRREEKSYSLITLQQLKREHPHCQLIFLMGSDMLLSFETWNGYKEILSLAQLCAVAREGEQIEKMMRMKKTLEALGGTVHVLDIPPMEISSTELRERLKHRLPVNEYLSRDVCQYISNKGLYQ